MSRQTQNAIVGGLAFLVAVLGMLVVVSALTGDDDSETAAIQPLANGVEAGNTSLTTGPAPGIDSSADVDDAAGAVPSADATTSTLAPVVKAPTTPAPTTAAPTTTVAPTTATTAAPTTEAPTTTEATSDDSMPASSDGSGSAGSDTDKTDSTPATDPPKNDEADKPETTQAPAEPDPTTATTAAPAPAPDPPTAPVGGLTGVEQEIIRLTNELRANPGGPLKREKPMPSCVNETFYSIQIDPGTNHPQAVSTLQVSESVSIQMARDWSFQMNEANRMYHRPGDSAKAKYAELGVNYRAYGENVAWGSGYAESAIARVFFEGWRESDTGHYCSMVAPIFTHFGVGHYRSGSLDWSTQNFYTLG